MTFGGLGGRDSESAADRRVNSYLVPMAQVLDETAAIMFSIPPVSERLTSRRASGAASSASAREHAVGHRPQVGPVLLEPFGQPVALVHRSHSSVGTCHVNDGSTPAV
jgi:hypothetical protein